MKQWFCCLLILCIIPSIYAEDINNTKVYDCRYMEVPPYGVTAWQQSEIVEKAKTGDEFPGKGEATVPPSADPVLRARENLVHVLFNHNDFVTIR